MQLRDPVGSQASAFPVSRRNKVGKDFPGGAGDGDLSVEAIACQLANEHVYRQFLLDSRRADCMEGSGHLLILSHHSSLVCPRTVFIGQKEGSQDWFASKISSSLNGNRITGWLSQGATHARATQTGPDRRMFQEALRIKP